MSDSIRVVCRLRPLNKIQIANNGEQCVTHGEKQINIRVGGQETKYSFAFDKIFGPQTEQVSIYKQVAIPIIKSVLSGFNGTIFAYGQTGGGKTWTMEGPNHHDAELKGLIPRTIQGLFEAISQSDENLEFVIKSSYVQIYNEKLFDLLDPSKARLQIKQDKQRGIFIQNCTQISVSGSQQMLKTMDSGSQNRKVAFTGMNQRSSRSHSLFIIHVFQKNVKKDSTKQSKLYFVDLAGSQKVGKTNVQGQQLEQAKNINKSLSSLGNVINALTSDKKQHVPYRDSKLTRILQESLGGNSKTTLIINCSMCTYNDRQTLSTLRFGYRAKSIKNKPKMNEQKSVKQLMALLDAANKTIAELRCQTKGQKYIPVEQEEKQDERDILIHDLRAEIDSYKNQESQRNKEMQIRIKQLLVELAAQKQEKSNTEKKWKGVFENLIDHLNAVLKFIKRSYVDIGYCMNVITMKNLDDDLKQSKETMSNTLKHIEEMQAFYDNNLKEILIEISKEEELYEQEILKNQFLTPEKRKTKFALSQPALFQKEGEVFDTKLLMNDDTQLSCIIQQQQNKQQNSYSDKVSQSSLTEFQTLIQSMQTKQSHRILIQQMAANMKDLKRENQEMAKKCQKMEEEQKLIAQKIQDKYEQTVMELEERVHQYKNIMHQKDIQFTKKFDEIDALNKKLTEEKIVGDRFKKIIETNGNMKVMHEMEEKLRNLANQRQKIFNQMYRLREQLDEAEITVKEKQEHIDSLKEVMKELNESIQNMKSSPQEIEKSYNTQVYGTETPKVMQVVKGGGKQAKKSSLRKKTNSVREPNTGQAGVSHKQTKQYIPFFKTFFN